MNRFINCFSKALLTVVLGSAMLFSATQVGAATNVTGSINGQILNSSGDSISGATVTIQNTDTGFSRSTTADADGRFDFSNLPVGPYSVTAEASGQPTTSRNTSVSVGTGSTVYVVMGEEAAQLGGVTVAGAAIAPIDISTTDTRTVFTAQQLQKIPVGRSIVGVALLTPGVVAADSRYAGTASFGGSAASENAFYINGYAVTNPLTNLGSTSLPFDAISQYQSITGGYGAEFGRATGGVVNIVTKSGTNDYKAGGILVFEPKSLRADQKDRIVPNNGGQYDGMVYQALSQRERDSMTYGLYASGPIVKDKAFFYVSFEQENRTIDGISAFTADPATTGYNLDVKVPRWIVKLDWNITNNHLLDFTAISDVTKDTERYYDECYAEGPTPCADPNDAFVRGAVGGGYYYEDGGELYIAKYTGYLTNNLTLSALYGKQDQDHIATPYQYDASVVPVRDQRQNVAATQTQGAYVNVPFQDAYDKTNGYRVDLEYRAGDHNLRLGTDYQELESRSGTQMAGPGYAWIISDIAPANVPADGLIPGGGGAVIPASNAWASKYIYENGGTFRVEQTALYLEDRWQVDDNWLLSLGIRSEGFKNFNADDIVYVEQSGQIAPRLGATWDVYGDSTFKAFAQLGRYHLAMPNNVALRGAAGSTYTQEYFSFTGFNPTTGEPIGLTALGNGPYSTNGEYGQAPDPNTVAAKDLKSHYQDELVVGIEKQLTDSLNFGVRWVYRDLKSAIDDMCDGRAALAWGQAHGYSAADSQAFYDQLNNCRLFNPGADNTFVLANDAYLNVGPNAPGAELVTIPLSSSELGYPKLKRKYNGFDFFLEHPFDGQFYYKVDYTWSQNYGNAEGQLQSDIGQGDVSQTIDWDHPELGEYGNGYLPNDRRHYIKAFGYWQVDPEWRVSGTFLAHSGRPENCLGYYNGPSNSDPLFPNYGRYYHYCDGQPSPRGSYGRLPWDTTLDVGATYMPAFADGNLQLSIDVFNIFDHQVVQNVEERRELGGSSNVYQYAGLPLSYSDPRMIDRKSVV